MVSIDDRIVFTGVSLDDSNDVVQLQSTRDLTAKVELLDQLGYEIVTHDDKFFIGDVENPDAAIVPLRNVATIDQALDEALAINRWKLNEPTEMVGGALPSNMKYDNQTYSW